MRKCELDAAKPRCRAPGNYDARALSRSVAFAEFGPSKAVQSQKDEADINKIVARYKRTGLLPVVQRTPLLDDFDGVFDYQSAQNTIVAANRAFMSIPSEIRARFGNDPGQFVAFCSDKENLDELRKLGLAPAVAPEAPAEAAKP